MNASGRRRAREISSNRCRRPIPPQFCISVAIATLEELGYKLKYKVLNAVDYGVPQQRERVILVGFRGDNNFEYPEPTHGDGLKPHVTLRQAIGDLPVLKSGQSSNRYAYQPDNDFLHFVRATPKELTEHSAPKNGDHLIRIMEALKDGQCKDDLPEDIRPKLCLNLLEQLAFIHTQNTNNIFKYKCSGL